MSISSAETTSLQYLRLNENSILNSGAHSNSPGWCKKGMIGLPNLNLKEGCLHRTIARRKLYLKSYIWSFSFYVQYVIKYFYIDV